MHSDACQCIGGNSRREENNSLNLPKTASIKCHWLAIEVEGLWISKQNKKKKTRETTAQYIKKNTIEQAYLRRCRISHRVLKYRWKLRFRFSFRFQCQGLKLGFFYVLVFFMTVLVLDRHSPRCDWLFSTSPGLVCRGDFFRQTANSPNKRCRVGPRRRAWRMWR